MRAKARARSIHWIFVGLALLAGTIGCDLTRAVAEPPAPPEEASTVAAVAPTPTEAQVTTISGPEGTILTLSGEALTAEAEVTVEVLRQPDPSAQGGLFESVGPEYQVSFGEGDQIGHIRLTVPLPQMAKLSAQAGVHVYAALARPEQGPASIVGVAIEEGAATMPIIGPGKYQVLQMLSPEAETRNQRELAPLSVPSYKSPFSLWFNPTALTNLAGYHLGAWPTGGYGAQWGESSHWYLAGVAGPSDSAATFFHWLIPIYGDSEPANVGLGFTGPNSEVIIWSWSPYERTDCASGLGGVNCQIDNAILAEFARSLFDAFRAYVLNNVWGVDRLPRPVAWHSSQPGFFSRTITGSNGTDLYFNHPVSGSFNESMEWETYATQVQNSIEAGGGSAEVAHTVVLHADPRPESERRAVLWLEGESAYRDGSILLRRGQEGTTAATLYHQGSVARAYGYYYTNPLGDLPSDPVFGVQFQAFTPDDVIEYAYSVRSISEAASDVIVQTELWDEVRKVPMIDLPEQTASVEAGGLTEILPAGSFPIVDLEPGLYHLKFILSQGGVVQDVKYIFFRMAPPGFTIQIPLGVLKQNALCREGPGTAYRIVTGFEPPQELPLVGVNAERTWGKFAAEVGGSKFQCWISLSLVELQGDSDVPILAPPPLPLTPTQSSCSQYTTAQTCSQHPECSWNRLVTPQVCQAK